MTFPTSPVDLQTATVNGVSYQYDLALTVWNRTLSSSGVSTSWSITQTGHGFAIGNWVYYNGSTWALTDNTVTNGNAVEAPLLITTITDLNKFIVTSEGLATGLSGLVPGETYFLSTAGTITATMPTTAGEFVKAVFRAVSTTSGYVIPQPTLSAKPTASSGQTLSRITSSFTQSAIANTTLYYIADATAGAIVVTLPPAATSNNVIINLKKINSNANTVSFIRSGTDTIDGGTTAVISVQYAAITIAADSVNNNWFIF